MVIDSNPSCFLLQALALRRRFREATDTLVAAIRRFDFSLYSPVLSNLFGPEVVAERLAYCLPKINIIYYFLESRQISP